MTHDLWSTLNARMFDYLAAVTLAELVAREKAKRAPGAVVLEDKRRLGPQPRARGGRDKSPIAA